MLLRNLFKPISFAVGKAISSPNVIGRKITEGIATITDIIANKGYKSSTKEWIDKNRNGLITNIKINRTPISSNISAFANLLTLGSWGEAQKRLKYDNLFHLSMIITYTLNGDIKKAKLEKLESLNFTNNIEDKPNTESFNVPLNMYITVGEAIHKTEEYMKNTYFTYDAYRNNCQDFIKSFLEANNLSSHQTTAFIKQDMVSLLNSQPQWTNSLTKSLTNIGAILL